MMFDTYTWHQEQYEQTDSTLAPKEKCLAAKRMRFAHYEMPLGVPDKVFGTPASSTAQGSCGEPAPINSFIVALGYPREVLQNARQNLIDDLAERKPLRVLPLPGAYLQRRPIICDPPPPFVAQRSKMSMVTYPRGMTWRELGQIERTGAGLIPAKNTESKEKTARPVVTKKSRLNDDTAGPVRAQEKGGSQRTHRKVSSDRKRLTPGLSKPVAYTQHQSSDHGEDRWIRLKNAAKAIACHIRHLFKRCPHNHSKNTLESVCITEDK